MLRGMIHVSADVMGSVNEYDVVVVGAGQAGLSAACALAKAGLDRERYVVLDANPGPGRETFGGRQLHTHDYRSAEDFRGQRVVAGPVDDLSPGVCGSGRGTPTSRLSRRMPATSMRADRRTHTQVVEPVGLAGHPRTGVARPSARRLAHPRGGVR